MTVVNSLKTGLNDMMKGPQLVGKIQSLPGLGCFQVEGGGIVLVLGCSQGE